VRRGRQAAQQASAGCRCLFASTGMCCRKARPRLTDLPDRSPASAKRGGLSLWLLFLWPLKEKVTRLPKADESSSLQSSLLSSSWLQSPKSSSLQKQTSQSIATEVAPHRNLAAPVDDGMPAQAA